MKVNECILSNGIDDQKLLKVPTEKETLLDVFNLQVKAFPHRLALIDGDESFTYEEVDQLSNRVATLLWRVFGTGVSPFVATLLPQGKDFIFTTLAIFKLRLTCGPLSIEYPVKKIQFMLEDMGNPILVSTSDILKGLYLEYSNAICLEEADLSPLIGQLERPWEVMPENPLAYVFYTSGSTGQPKGVTMEHRPLLFDVFWCQQRFELDNRSRTLLFLNPAFSFTTEEIWPCVVSGGTLVIAPTHLKYDLLQLRTWMEEMSISIITLPAPLAQQFYTLPLYASKSKLRWLNCGSGVLSFGVPKNLPYGVLYCYGSTEALRIAETCLCVASEEAMEPFEIVKFSQTNVGRPIRNVEVYILDEQLELVPAGSTGEIFVGGAHISQGYLQRQDLTQEKFLQNPFSENGRLYRTGDFGRWTEDGSLEIQGRIDDQVKVNGHRVELAEIKQLLLESFPAVQNVIVLSDHSDERTKIHAFCVLDTNNNSLDWSTEKAYEILQNRLPHYALPTTISCLSELPLNANGKLDRQTLLQMKRLPSKSEKNEVKNKFEQIVSEVWARMLKMKPNDIGLSHNFFALGGNSMLAAKVVATLQGDPWNFCHLKMFHMFAAPTLQRLANVLEGTNKSNNGTITLEKSSSECEEFPLSFQQEQIWLYMQQTNYPGLYMKISAIKFPGADADTSLIEESVNLVLRRHPVLQVNIFERNGTVIQKLNPKPGNRELEIVDLSHEKVDEASLLSDARLKDKVRRYIKVTFDQFLRFLLVRTNSGVILIVFSHHLVIDGIGIRLLHLEVTNAYYSLKKRNPVDLPNVKFQYLDYVLWQRLGDHSEMDEMHSEFWRSRLTRLSPLDLPSDFPRLGNSEHKQTGVKRFLISSEIAKQVNKFAQKMGTTVFITLLSAFKALCFRYTKQEDIFVLVPTDGRGDTKLEPLIGHFVNMMIVRDFISEKDTFAALVEKVRASFSSSFEHQEFPLQKVIETCGMERKDAGLLRVCVGMEPKLFTESILESSAQYDLATNLGTTIFELFVNFEEVESGLLRGMIEFDRNVYTEERMDRLVSHFTTLLTNGVTNEGMAIEHLQLMTEDETKEVISFGISKDQSLLPLAGETLLSMFKQQSSKTPDAVAVEDGEILLTFAELDNKSEKLSIRLGSGSIFVGVLLPTDASYIVTILAVLKAGKAIVPIDTSQPRQTVLGILEALNFPTLVTTRELKDRHVYRFSFCIDEFDYDNEDPIECLFQNPSSGSLSYVLHTSGSTGIPKPVQDVNNGLVNVVKWFRRELAIGSDDRQLLFTSPGFDGSIAEIWPCLCGGGTLVVCPQKLRYDVDHMRSWVIAQKLTRLNFTSVLAEMFYNVNSSIFESAYIRSLVCGGERIRTLPPKDLPFSVFNVYGVTEASVWSTALEMVSYHKELGNSSGAIPIGRPMASVDVYVLDKNLNFLPVGVTGEIFIGGISVSPGYLSRPELNAEKFLTNPHVKGDRVYRTGDFGYWRSDGNLVCLGRIDEQVKIRGFRVELGEIENILLEFPSVVSSVVVSEKSEDSHQLHAFVTTLPPDVDVCAEDVDIFLRERLPNWSIPSTITQLVEFPLNSSGKVDKKAVLKLKSNKLAEKVVVLPRTQLESFLLGIWSEVLGIESQYISVTENFFSLGGNSLLIGKLVNILVAKIEMHYGRKVEISIASVFANATIRKQGDSLSHNDFLNITTPL